MEGESYPRRIETLAHERALDRVYWHVPIEGDDQGFSWSQLEQWSRGVAHTLAGRGVVVGDRVAVGLRNSPAFVVSTFATWRLGAVPVPVRWDLPDWERQRVQAVIDGRVELGTDDLGWIDACRRSETSALADVTSSQMNGICSSGSTGTPKVILTNQPALCTETLGIPMMTLWRPVTRPQRVLVPAPMYHANGFSTLLSLLAGDEIYVMEKFDAAGLLDAIERRHITTFTATPTMLKRIADVPGIDDRDLSSIDWILQGAASMPPSLVCRWAELLGAERIVMAYGMTEGLGVTAVRGDEWMEHRGSVGRGIRGTEVRVLDEKGNDAPTGVIGGVYLRSPTYQGYTYLGGPALEQGTADGFETVGDLGYLDADGFLYLVDRRVDLIISGGANVYPAEVEAALMDHPKVADVVVIGLADEQWGRRVHAVVEPKDVGSPPSEADLIGYAKQRLAAYKVPKTVEIVETIPRSAATKVNRAALVEARGG